MDRFASKRIKCISKLKRNQAAEKEVIHSFSAMASFIHFASAAPCAPCAAALRSPIAPLLSAEAF